MRINLDATNLDGLLDKCILDLKIRFPKIHILVLADLLQEKIGQLAVSELEAMEFNEKQLQDEDEIGEGLSVYAIEELGEVICDYPPHWKSSRWVYQYAKEMYGIFEYEFITTEDYRESRLPAVIIPAQKTFEWGWNDKFGEEDTGWRGYVCYAPSEKEARLLVRRYFSREVFDKKWVEEYHQILDAQAAAMEIVCEQATKALQGD